MMRSALARVLASDGTGRKVWEFTPSGTMPVTCARSPATFSTILVIGATVVTTRRGAAGSRAGSASIDPSSSARAMPVPVARDLDEGFGASISLPRSRFLLYPDRSPSPRLPPSVPARWR